MMNEESRKWLNEQFEGDQETIAAVWEEYVASATGKLAEARTALAAFDFPLLDRIAHTIKGNALMVGDQQSATAGIALRDAAKASDPDAAAKALDQLESLDRANHA